MIKKTIKKVQKKTGKTTKKTVAKKAVKKPAIRAVKATPRKPARKITVRRAAKSTKITPVIATPENAFYAVNGSVSYSLLDLYSELGTMLEEEFSYHSDPEENHFSNWIKDVLQDEECAESLRKANTRRKARATLKKHLDKYSF